MANLSSDFLASLRQDAKPLQANADLDPVLDRIGDARLVLLGEASHGTSEYYRWRAQLSKRLVLEKKFSFIAVEGDWPDCYTVNRFVKGYQGAGDAASSVLNRFKRWPTWMWANWEVVALSEWLRNHNSDTREEERVGFYGLDVYSLWESLDEIMRYLQKHEPDAVQAAQNALICFQPHDRDVQSYAWASQLVPQSCQEEVLKLLVEVRRSVKERADYKQDYESDLNAEQNAYVAANAERYYRTMVWGGGASWNVRDHHMVDTLQRLLDYHGPDSRAIVWEHNTHIGDARATDMAAADMVNVGQLARERWGEDQVVLIGFGSYQGTVIAGARWGAPMQTMEVPPARRESWEDFFHQVLGSDGLFVFDRNNADRFGTTRPHRAIGVVYNPEFERRGNYVPTLLNRRYDAFMYIDQSYALHPLHLHPERSIQPPDTYPWAG